MKHRERAVLSSSLIALLFACALAGSLPAFGGDLASIAGRVLDTGGHPLAGAQVTLSGVGWAPTGVKTSSNGDYRIWGVRTRAGYRIEAKQAGFRSVEYDGLFIAVGERRIVQFRLKRIGEREAVALVSRDPFPHADLVRAFLDGLGVTSRVVDLDAEIDPAETVRHVAAEKPDLILAAGLKSGRLVRSEVRDIPSILTLIPDPRVYDLKAPNICFLQTNPAPAEVIRRVAALLPGVRRLGLVYDGEDSGLVARDLREEADRHGLTVDLLGWFDAPRHVNQLLAQAQDRVDAILVPYDPIAVTPEALEAITGWCLRHRVPLIAPQAEWVRHGALLSYGVSLEEMGAQARSIARQILFNARQPENFALRYLERPVLSINRETAATLGVTLREDDEPAAAAPDSRARWLFPVPPLG